MRKRVKASFDPKIFLAKVGEGKTISKYRKDQIVFSQGEVADAVFYIQQGKIKLTVVSEQGKEAVVAILGPGHFFSGRQAGTDRGKVQSGNAGGDDRHDPITGKLFHEQIPQIGFYRIQWKTGSP